jgi:hypothetical protein
MRLSGYALLTRPTVLEANLQRPIELSGYALLTRPTVLVSVDRVRNVNIFLSSMPEQCKIVELLNNNMKKFDIIVEKCGSQVQLLQERRVALISAAVTGKNDVRNWGAPEQQTNKDGTA